MDGSVASRRVGPPRPGIAERILDAARTEFSKRGFHGARVQGIARGAACNVALIYRHWASKRALYLDILRSVWLGASDEISRLVDSGAGGPQSVIGAYLDAMMNDPMGAQILVRETLDGAPFLSQLTVAEPALLEPVRRAAAVIAASGGDARIDPLLAVLTVGGLAALVASAQEAFSPFLPAPLPPEVWRRHVLDLLSHGLVRGQEDPSRVAGLDGAAGTGIPATTNGVRPS
jgi:TetR/AcrR family transcriptional regulator